MNLAEELQWRGFANQTTYKSLDIINGEPITFYWGVDPSAASMTIGNLAAAMMVRHFINHGHNAVLLIGGATGMIGDPDGKVEERNLLSVEQIQDNKHAIVEQYKKIFDNQQFEIVDNYDWFQDMGYLGFLRDIGKHVPMRQMMGRDFVQKRLTENGAGISYAEFSYVLIQAYDFLHLNREKGVTLQVCGSDQWGNSIAGVDLVRRITGNETHVWSAPLIIDKTTGKKFGKSESGAIWLEASLTSIYKFYQFWLNIDDESVIDYLKIFTLLDKDEIDELSNAFDGERGARLPHKKLAYEVTKLVHGTDQAAKQKNIADALFGSKPVLELTEAELAAISEELPTIMATVGDLLASILVSGQLAVSTTEARRFIEAGAIYVNNKQLQNSASDICIDQSWENLGYILVRRGKNTQMLVKIS